MGSFVPHWHRGRSHGVEESLKIVHVVEGKQFRANSLGQREWVLVEGKQQFRANRVSYLS